MKSFWIQVTLNIINGILVRKGSWIFEIQRHRKEHRTTVSEWVLWLWVTMPWVAGSCQKAGEWHRTAFSFWAAEGVNPAGTLFLWMQDKYVLHCWVDMLALGFLRQVFRLAWNSLRSPIRYWTCIPPFILSNSGIKGICLPSGNTMTLNFWPPEPWKSKFVILGNLFW